MRLGKAKIVWGCWTLGVALHIIAVVLRTDPAFSALASVAVGAVSAAALVFGTVVYAKTKGYSPWFGLAGLLSILGIAVLLVLPPRLHD